MSDLPELSYFRPRDLAEALAALASPNACIYAGGTDLLVALTTRQPWAGFVRELVDIKRLDAAKGITELGNTLRIGALVTAAELATSALLRRETPVLAEAAARTSAPALRRRGTLGGNIATPHPAGDVTTALLALDAVVELIDGHSAREAPLSELVATRTREWPRRRLVLAVKVEKCRRSAFEKIAARSGFGRSLVAVAIAIGDGGARLALGGMNDRPFAARETALALGQPTQLAEALARECRPPADGLASPSYRMKLADVLIARAALRAGRA